MTAWDAMPWMAGPVMIPLSAAVLAFLVGRRALPWLPAIVIGVVVVALTGLTAEVWLHGPQGYAIGGWRAPLGINWYADGLSVLMLWLAAGVAGLASLYALDYFRHEPDKAAVFWPLWLLLWTALNALFLSADLFNLYVGLELVTLSGVPLIVLAGGRTALAAGMRYLLFALLGSLAYLLGVALLYGRFGVLDMNAIAAGLTPEPLGWTAIALMTVGLLIKTAVFPLHIWLPPAHSAAPTPVSAALSALVVKASFYLLLRLWFWVFPEALTPAAGQFLGVLGGAAILYGSVQALRQVRLKLLVAYSTVAQLGYLLLLFPLAGLAGWQGAIYQVLSHGFAKAALFLAAGNVLHVLGHDRITALRGHGERLAPTLFAFGLAGVGIMGLPPSGGFLAKWLLLEAALDSGQWWWALVILAGGLLAAGYVFRVLRQAFLQAETDGGERKDLPRSMAFIPLILALIALGLGFAAAPILAILAVGPPPFLAEIGP